MRDYSSHRMLARFGLPHLRTRVVRFYINNVKLGFYTLMEAVDQEYVFARSFPNFDPSNYALYKVKSPSIGCGAYSDAQLAAAQAQVDDLSKPPYYYERGEHIAPVPALQSPTDCLGAILGVIDSIETDVATAWLRAGGNRCGPMLVEEGLIDRDLGSSNWDPVMEDFIDEHLAASACNEGCANSILEVDVDVDNFLKNFALYAVTTNTDSPLGNGNNYYLAEAGDGSGWKIMPYDHNARGDPVCDFPVCDQRIVFWSISRPTCRSLEDNQLVGPLLTNPVYFDRYIWYAREVVDTIISNSSFIEELSNHAMAIQEEVATDPWSGGGVFYAEELSPEASVWNSSSGVIPLLPTLKARAVEVRAQLKALDANIITKADYADPSETCLDWRTQKSDDVCPSGQSEVVLDFAEFRNRQCITVIPEVSTVTTIAPRSAFRGRSARVFDTSIRNWRDLDLVSPNETCDPPGFGRGAGGESGQLGANCFPQGIQEKNGEQVDDSMFGGTIRFDFEESKQYTQLLNVGLLDIDERARIITIDRSSVEMATSSAGLGNNAFQEVKVGHGHDDVLASVSVVLGGSGAISYLTLCEAAL